MKSKAQFNFVWIFALVAGGAILVLAVYGAITAGDNSRHQTDSEIAKAISVITDSLQAGPSDASKGQIIFKQETRINNVCDTDGSFGRNVISVATQSKVGKPWNDAGVGTSSYNKYFFSEEQVSGMKFNVFSRPFEFPYKISDLTIIVSDNYCFKNVPEEIVDDINNMNSVKFEIENCTLLDSINVCFDSGNDCDITVYGSCVGSQCDSRYDLGNVLGPEGEMRYVENLLYAAIFSDKDIYDCNVERLMYRTSLIAEGFAEKASLMDARGCGTNLNSDLVIWSSLTKTATSEDLFELKARSDQMNRDNFDEVCGVW